MKFNKWTLALAAGGVVSLGSIAQAEEKPMSQVMTAVSSTTLSGSEPQLQPVLRPRSRTQTAHRRSGDV